MKHQREFLLSAACFLMALLCQTVWLGQREDGLAARIAPALLRFHVIANSNSARDQQIKTEVKSLLLNELEEVIRAAEIGTSLEDAQTDADQHAETPTVSVSTVDSLTNSSPHAETPAVSVSPEDSLADTGQHAEVPAVTAIPEDAPDTKTFLCEYIETHHEALEADAAAYMQAKGFDYPVRIRIAQNRFPTKYYGDITLPGGIYDAVEVTLGQGRGRNWWCLLYPRLCFVDAAHAEVPAESKEELRALLDEEDYEALTDDRDVKICVRFRLLDWLFGA